MDLRLKTINTLSKNNTMLLQHKCKNGLSLRDSGFISAKFKNFLKLINNEKFDILYPNSIQYFFLNIFYDNKWRYEEDMQLVVSNTPVCFNCSVNHSFFSKK